VGQQPLHGAPGQLRDKVGDCQDAGSASDAELSMCCKSETKNCHSHKVIEFTLTGGYNRGFGIFVESVIRGSSAYKKGRRWKRDF